MRSPAGLGVRSSYSPEGERAAVLADADELSGAADDGTLACMYVQERQGRMAKLAST